MTIELVGIIVTIALLIALTPTVASINRKVNLILKHLNVDPSQRLRISERVKQLAHNPAYKIEAIKVHREETGASLADAKEAVEAYIDSQQGKG